MFRSIRWRLVASYALLTLLTVSLVGVLALSLVQRYVEQRVVADLTANAEAVARQARPLMRPVTQLAALNELARTSAFLGNARVKIFDDRRQVLADSGAPTDAGQLVWLSPPVPVDVDLPRQPWVMVIPDVEMVQPVFPSDSPFSAGFFPRETDWVVVRRVEGVWGTRFSFEIRPPERQAVNPLPPQVAPRSGRVVTVPIGETDRPMGYVELGAGPDFSAEAVATTRRAFLLAGSGALALAILVGLLVSHGLTNPLRKLTATAAQMSDDLSARASVRGRDEIGQLAGQLNRMAERLQVSFADLAAERDALRRFVADASHELRTPITALRNFNELLQDADPDPDTRGEFLAESAAQLERLEWITHNLLDLSRLDAGLVALELARHEVGELIAAASAPFQVAARDKELQFSISPLDGPTEIVCDRARVELALSNLLDNAFKFTPAGGWVAVGAELVEGQVRLWVGDSGPGIHPDDLPHIFERFYRGRTQAGDGSGLGLAIVKSVAGAHGGRVWAESQLGVGSRFVIELPQERRTLEVRRS